MKPSLAPAILIATLLTISPAAAQVVAEVGGVSITRQQVLAANPAAASDKAAYNNALITLINQQTLMNEAKRQGILNQPEYKTALAQAEINIAANLLAQNYFKTHPISEQDIVKTYNELASKPAPEEYRFRLILVKTYAQAEAALQDIRNGKDFSDVAAAVSLDSSAPLGGEVGWQLAPQIQAPLLGALKNLKPSQVTGPLAVANGYVILQLLDQRQAPKPSLAQVHDQIKTSLEQQAWNQEILRLRTAQGARLITPLPGAP
jgi:peptidyl-prolyl cis-trans isomerase C